MPTGDGAIASFDGIALRVTDAQGREVAQSAAAGVDAHFAPWGNGVAALLGTRSGVTVFRMRGARVEALPALDRALHPQLSAFSDDGEHVLTLESLCDTQHRCRRLAGPVPVGVVVHGETVAWTLDRALVLAPAGRRTADLHEATAGCATLGPLRVEEGAFTLIATRCSEANAGDRVTARRVVVTEGGEVRSEPLGRFVVDLLPLGGGASLALESTGALLHAADRSYRWTTLPDRVAAPGLFWIHPPLRRVGDHVIVDDRVLLSAEAPPPAAEAPDAPLLFQPPPAIATTTEPEPAPRRTTPPGIYPLPLGLRCQLTRSQRLPAAPAPQLVNVDTLASITSRDEFGPSLLTWRGASRGSRMVEFSHPDFLGEEAPTSALAEPRGLWLFTEQNAIAWAPAGSGAGFTVADRLWPGLREQGFVAATAAPATLAVVGVWDDPPHGAHSPSASGSARAASRARRARSLRGRRRGGRRRFAPRRARDVPPAARRRRREGRPPGARGGGGRDPSLATPRPRARVRRPARRVVRGARARRRRHRDRGARPLRERPRRPQRLHPARGRVRDPGRPPG